MKKIRFTNRIKQQLFSATLLLFFVLFLFGDILFRGDSTIFSFFQSDIHLLFAHWRQFGFEEIKNGNFPLWNPYIYAGAPFFEGFQAGLLYPPNWIYIVVPLSIAINIDMVLHLMLPGIFVFTWTRYRKSHYLSSLVAAAITILGGSHYFQLSPGHLPHLAAMAWIPLILWSVDGMLEKFRFRWFYLGSFAFAMQIFAGFPQYAYYTCLILVLYVVFYLCLVKKNSNETQNLLERIRSLSAGFFYSGSVIAGGLALSCIQWLPGILAGKESIRGYGVSHTFASSFHFPIENLLTSIMPSFFGDSVNPNWGRSLVWESNVYVGCLPLLLGFVGFFCKRDFRKTIVFLLIMMTTIIISFGDQTPIYNLLHEWLPFFNKLRGINRITFFSTLFIAMLVSIGFDHVLLQKQSHEAPTRKDFSIRLACMIGLWLTMACLLFYTSIKDSKENIWLDRLISFEINKLYRDRPEVTISHSDFPEITELVKWNLHYSGSLFCLGAGLLFLARRYSKVGYLLGIMALFELLIFARQNTLHSNLQEIYLPSKIENYFASLPNKNKGRVLWLSKVYRNNITMSLGLSNIWGYGPDLTGRHARLIHVSQEKDPNQLSEYTRITQNHRIFELLGLKYILSDQKISLSGWELVVKDRYHEGKIFVYEKKGPVIANVYLVENWQNFDDSNVMFELMNRPDFDARKFVMVEQPLPYKSPQVENVGSLGTCEAVDIDSDTIEIRATLNRPAVLINSGSYHSGWRAVDTSGRGRSYEVIPAYSALRAIPLTAGEHIIRLEYLPIPFVFGKAISIGCIVLFLASGVVVAIRRRGM